MAHMLQDSGDSSGTLRDTGGIFTAEESLRRQLQSFVLKLEQHCSIAPEHATFPASTLIHTALAVLQKQGCHLCKH